MSYTLTVTGSLDGELLKFDDLSSEIAHRKEEYADLDATQDYEATRVAIRSLVSMRTALEKTRKTLKADALEYGRRVDGIAKAHLKAIEEIEAPLQASKDGVDEAKATLKREKEEAERRQIEAEAKKKWEADQAEQRKRQEEEIRLHAEEKKKLMEEAARLKKEREEYEAQIREERALEAKARAILLHEQQLQDEEFRRLKAAERIRIEEERLLAEAEYAKEKAIEAERKAIEAANAKRIKEEQVALEAKLLAEAEKERLDALLPDKEKLLAFVFRLKTVEQPPLKTLEGERALKIIIAQVDGIYSWIDMWEGRPNG